jgi:hypothetical protein
MKRILFLILFVGIAFSCDKQYYTSIPNVPVNLDLNLNGLDSKLNAKLAYEIFTKPRVALEQLGYGGILVINGVGENQVDLYAFDLTCPVEAQPSVRIIPDSTGVTAHCPKCGTVFNIADGTGAPKSGGTKYFLKSYRVSGIGPQYTVVN